MAELGLPQPKPNVGIRGNTEETPMIKRSESIMQSSTHEFQNAINGYATTPTALAQIATKAAIGASNSLMDKWGYEAGLNPSGNMLPAITNADARFAAAYHAQSQATIGLQANQLMINAQNEMDKAYKLTPGLIESYSKNVAEGLNGLMQNAPDAVKPAIHNQFASALQRSTGSLNSKMIGQQKAQYQSEMAVYSQSQIKSIYETVRGGDVESGKKQLDGITATNKKLKDAGVISATEAENRNQSAKQSYNTALYSQQAINAMGKGKLEDYLYSMSQSKPAGMSFLDWQDTKKNVLSAVAQQESLQRREQSLNGAEFNLAIIQQRVSQDLIEKLRETQTPEQFANSMAKFSTNQNKVSATTAKENDLIGQWGSPIAHADNTSTVRNATFNRLVGDYQNNQRTLGKGEISDIEAKTVVANSAGAEVPQFTSELNNMFISGNPALMTQASNAYSVVGSLKAPISQKALAMKFAYASQIAQGRNPDDAAMIAKENIGPRDDKQLRAIDESFKEFKNINLKDFTSKSKFANSLLNKPWFSSIQNQAALTTQVIDAYESNYRLLGGDEEAAKKMTEHNLKQVYGTTYGNGQKEFTYLPLEKFVGVDSGASGIIQHHLANQIEPQIAQTKLAYDAGTNEFYYRIKPRVSYDEAISAKEQIAKDPVFSVSRGLMSGKEYLDNRKKYQELKTKVDSFADNNPVLIEKVWRHGEVEEYQAIYEASNNIGLGINASTPVVGAYDITLKDKNGISRPLLGAGNLSNGQAYFRPDIEGIKQMYYAIHGLNENDELHKKQKAIDEAQYDALYKTLRASIY
jgi:hypothetical protein